MEVIIICICVALCLVVGYFSFKIGKKQGEEKECAIVRLHNEAIMKERADLQNSIDREQGYLRDLKGEYQEKLDFIKSAKEKAEQEYKDWQQNFLEKEKQIEQQFNNEQITIQEGINLLQLELDSLKQQKAATIEAFRKEEAIKEQADLYRLKITDIDRQDIDFLKSIQYRISKPRLLAMLIWQNYFLPIAKEKFSLILGSDEVCGIYKITSLNTNKCYIGQAKKMRNRWYEHCKAACGIDCPQGNKLYQAMQEEGLDNFSFELLESCLPEQLDSKETYYIDLYNSVNYGYNGISGKKKRNNGTN